MTDRLFKKREKEYDYKEAFEQAYDLIKSIRVRADSQPLWIRESIDDFLKEHSEEIYGIKDYIDE